MKKISAIVLLLFAYSYPALAQHDMKSMPGMHQSHMTDTATGNEMGNMDMGDTGTSGGGHMKMEGMNSGQSLNLPMNRDGSGTSWLPDAAPVFGYMMHVRRWMLMFHGDVFVRYNRQDLANAGTRGADKLDAPDMLMFMGQTKTGEKGLFRFSTMFSTDALIAGGSGYPLLFQTGESWHGPPW